MKILFHPKIDWESWQAIKQSSIFQSLSSGEQICLTDRLPPKLWQQEQSAKRNSAEHHSRLLQQTFSNG